MFAGNSAHIKWIEMFFILPSHTRFFCFIAFSLVIVLQGFVPIALAEQQTSVTLRIPKSTPRVTLLGHEAVLLEEITELPEQIAKLKTRWQTIRTQHSQSVYKANNIPLNKYRLQQWREIGKQFPTMDSMKQLRVINGFFNMIPSSDDQKLYGVKEYWATPQEFLKKGRGDCEDYAIAKYFALQYLAWNDNDLWVVILDTKKTPSGHAVLAARVKKNFFILDNLSKPEYLLIPEAQYAKHITPRYLINNQGLWAFLAS